MELQFLPRRLGEFAFEPVGDQLHQHLAVKRIVDHDLVRLFIEVVLQCRSHFRARSMQQDPLVGFGDAEQITHLNGAELRQVAQRDHLALGQR